MRIKRLKLAGFKSFVDPVELRIEPGLTGIVGPNGCGKSNLLEAIRWVMGESSPKSMRGGGMDDVIFAGTDARPSRDYAEVAITAERAGGEDIEIVRRIERGAGSAWRNNGLDVRAKDAALIFADAATGAHSPALVSQGRIGSVVSAKPAERRQLLEEAAGVAGLHVRRKDAEQKLRATETNLSRLDDLIADMESRAAHLRRQARAAGRYRILTEAIELAEARLVFARWRDAADAAKAAHDDAELAETQVAVAAEAQRAIATHQADAARALSERRSAAQAAREAALATEHQLATARGERASLERRMSELASRLNALAHDRSREEALAGDAAQALARLAVEESGLVERLAGATERRDALDARVADAETASRKLELELARALATQAARQADARVADANREAAAQRLQRVEADAAQIAAEFEALGEIDPLVGARDEAGAARNDAERDAQAARDVIEAAERRRTESSDARDAAEIAATVARATLAGLTAEADAIVKALAGGSADKALARIEAVPGHEAALAAALGDDLEAGLEADGARRWTGAKIEPDDPALPAGAEPLADYVDAPMPLARRLAQIGVVDRDDGSLTLAVGQRLVTRDGQMRRWDGYVARGEGAATAERLIRGNRLKVLQDELPVAREALENAAARVAGALASLTAARIAAEDARAMLAEAEDKLREAARAEDVAAAAIEALAARRESLGDRLDRTSTELNEARGALVRETASATALPSPAGMEEILATLSERSEAARLDLADARAEAVAIARSISADGARLAAAGSESDSWRARSADAVRRIEEIGERAEAVDAEAALLANAPETLDRQIRGLGLAGEAAAALAEEARRAEQAGEALVAETEHAAHEASERLAEAREARAGASARLESAQSRRREMERIAAERFECAPQALPDTRSFKADAVEEAALESAMLERRMAERERLGPVNLVAERELEAIERERGVSLRERDELGEAINRLRGSIGSLNREGRVRLLAAFQDVDRHFRRLFATLFEGGAAHLALIDADDPLEAGLEIYAQPPGKKLAALTLLSGGEQALTAIALIFALFLTNPAPICVLDEVDAPLDDANIERFCDLLDRMTEETDTRYLIVTHNAVTMARMHRLFGVTMAERGVSRLVSVDLGGAETLLAAE